MKTTNFRRLLALLLALILLGSAVVYADEGAAAPAEEPAEEPAVELQLPEEWTEEEALGEEPVVLFEGPDELAEPELLPEEDPRFAAFAEDPEALPVLNEATRSPIPETPADEPVPIGGTPDFSKMTDAQIVAYYQIPNNWARPALIFAVRMGLMSGRGDGTLSPTANTTRAEVATMLMRVLRTTRRADLSGFKDMSSSAWYYDAMARAVAAGLFNGAGNQMMPNDNITREQCFAVLARMFGVYSNDVNAVYRFPDGTDVATWAKPTMAAMINAGYVNGAKGKLNPKGKITRQELAQVLYNLLTGIGTTMPASYKGSYALAADSLASGTVVQGDLLLSNEVSSLTLQNVTVTGRLTIQGTGDLVLNLVNCSIGTLSICRPTTLNINGKVGTINVLAETTVNGSCTTLNAFDTALLNGSATNALLFNGTLLISTGSTIGTLTVDSGRCINYGAIGTLNVFMKNFNLPGSGTVTKANIYKPGFTSTNRIGTQDDSKIDPGLDGVKAVRTESGVPSATSPTITLYLKLTGFGSYPRDRYFDAEWRIDGTLLRTTKAVKMAEGVQLSLPVNFINYIRAKRESAKITVTLRYDGTQKAFGYTLNLGSSLVDTSVVRTQDVQARITFAVNIFSDFNPSTLKFSGNTGKIAQKGEQVTFLYCSQNTGSKIRLADGTTGWVAYSAVQAIPGNYYTTEHYSTAVKEAFVNQKGYSSKTGYLIWVSLWTQEVNVFTGSKGNWKLLRADPCSSGANACPTPVESVEILYKQAAWYYTEYYCHHVSVFDPTRGFHSWPIKNGTTSTVYDSAMGWPNSQSCIRMMDEAVTWIYDNVPVGTAVEIY